MKIIKEPDIRKLRLKGKVSGQDGKKIETVRPTKEVKPGPDAGDRQAAALENMTKVMALMLQNLYGDNKKSEVLLEMVRKIEDIKMPETWTRVKFTPERDGKGFITQIVVEKI